MFLHSGMKPQTEDILRCVCTVVFVMGVAIGMAATTPAWFMSSPWWLQMTLVVVLLWASYFVFNFRPIAEPDQVSFDERAITRILSDGTVKKVRWDDLQEVGIVTTDEGPWVDDVYWMLVDSNGGCSVSKGTRGMNELLARLQQLPGFDNEVFTRAMGSTDNNEFVCWKRRVEECAQSE